uniref:Uncharacterized protein n=1 Tax=Chromera velia CCMP2878 TaxID=1169474 RepID=A0A0G4HXU1_9ALVE|eukprot:Cvel_33306.t1-p1 / transcript=Cvel_33306.t1 / gene=Cvel_33306 / organism=Chromera_velia_CCMP2878 / gene_product=hypothetical protein / transcript_product=hypothetical protein / location=Cvel_scaffold5373:4716-5156(-) / protein_length=147 / sequence_SO=supercontig / SO=protein_coding / is_pseudo=false
MYGGFIATKNLKREIRCLLNFEPPSEEEKRTWFYTKRVASGKEDIALGFVAKSGNQVASSYSSAQLEAAVVAWDSNKKDEGPCSFNALLPAVYQYAEENEWLGMRLIDLVNLMTGEGRLSLAVAVRVNARAEGIWVAYKMSRKGYTG